MELPGVEKQAIDVNVENDVLRVDARLDFTKYEGLEPLYTEYNIGHFARSFTLSNKIDQQQISAQLGDGVLTLTLKRRRRPCGGESRSTDRRSKKGTELDRAFGVFDIKRAASRLDQGVP